MTSAPSPRTPHGGFAARMWRYIATMSPIPSRLGYAVLVYLAIAFFVADVHDRPFALVSWTTALGIFDVFALLLLLRLMDELKDYDIDARLFPDRPLPAGHVRASDIRWSIAIVTVGFVAANTMSVATLAAALTVLAFTYLMFVHFFAKAALRRSLLLTLATHQPIVPLVIGLGITVASASLGLTAADLDWALLAPFVLILWMPFLAWEICRKIRAPEQETAYVTYSRILGVRGSVAFAAMVQAIALGAGFALAVALELSPAYAAVLALAAGAMAWTHARFLRAPVPERAVLKERAQALLVVLTALQVLEFGVIAGGGM